MTKAQAPLALQTAHMSRTAGIAQGCARLASQGRGHEMLTEAVALNVSAMERISDLQSAWAAQWETWLDYARALPEVDTIPKLVDRSNNVVLQAQSQMASQVTDLTELAENMAVSYSFWLNKQLEDE